MYIGTQGRKRILGALPSTCKVQEVSDPGPKFPLNFCVSASQKATSRALSFLVADGKAGAPNLYVAVSIN